MDKERKMVISSLSERKNRNFKEIYREPAGTQQGRI